MKGMCQELWRFSLSIIWFTFMPSDNCIASHRLIRANPTWVWKLSQILQLDFHSISIYPILLITSYLLWPGVCWRIYIKMKKWIKKVLKGTKTKEYPRFGKQIIFTSPNNFEKLHCSQSQKWSNYQGSTVHSPKVPHETSLLWIWVQI